MGDEQERRRLWFELYGDMVPEKIVDTMIGEDGKRYYKVQWASTTIESSKNFLEAEHLIEKYWDPVEKKLKIPSKECNSIDLKDNDAADGGYSGEKADIQDGDIQDSKTEVLFNDTSYETHLSSILNSKLDQSKEMIGCSLECIQPHGVMLNVSSNGNDDPDPASQVQVLTAESVDSIVMSMLPDKTINDVSFLPCDTNERYDTSHYNLYLSSSDKTDQGVCLISDKIDQEVCLVSNETNVEKVLDKNLKRHINLEDNISNKKKRDT